MPTKEEVAQRLANMHFSIEEGMKGIYRIRRDREEMEALPEEPIKLLEVNELTVAVGVMPLGFDSAPRRGIVYPSIIVEVTPDEFERIQSRQMRLPEDWILAESLPRPIGSNGEA